MKNKTKTICTALLALLIWFALILQFSISIAKNMEIGRSLMGSLVFLLSFYTIQTNLLIAVALTAILKPDSSWGRFFSRISVLTAIAIYILIVGLIYAIILKGRIKLEGLFVVADFLLHTVSPILYVVYWLLFVTKQPIKWNQLLSWAIFPLAYLVYSLIRGIITNEYPYHFINAADIGYTQVVINSFFVLLAFIVLGVVFITLSRVMSKNPSKHLSNK